MRKAQEAWFKELFGFVEGSFASTQSRLKATPIGNCGKWFLEGENGCRYHAGRFTTPSLAELEALTQANGGMAALPGKLRVRNTIGDVATKHADPENRHATFQVASQFNCLEFVGPKRTPEDGITRYVNDRTQGPACCIAAGPATAFRNYFADVDGGVGQTASRQINNLEGVIARLGSEDKFFKVSGGYTLAENQGLAMLNEHLRQLSPEDYQTLRRALRVGVHEDVQVTSTNWGANPVRDESQTVTQVFGSACSVSYSRNGKALWAPFSSLVLSASYEATLWSALGAALRHQCAGSRRVYLTCIGGGVFGNSLEWITKAMQEAFELFENVGLEVFIVTYQVPGAKTRAIDPKLLNLEKRFG